MGLNNEMPASEGSMTTATASAPASWADAQEALREAVRRVTSMMRTAPDGNAPAVGGWSVAEVAMHLSQAWVYVPALASGDLSRAYEVLPSLVGTSRDSLIRDLWDLADVTKAAVASDPERDLGVLADRIDERAAQFFAESVGKSASEPRAWMVEGSTVPRAALTCHLLNETTMHGYDMARASGMPWRIEPSHAAMILGGFLVETIRALDPRALVDQERASGLRATYDLRLRGGDRFTFVFDDGELRVEGPSTGRVDCHLSADPVALLLVAWGRRSQWPAIAKGQLLAWGRKPWLGPRLRLIMRNP